MTVVLKYVNQGTN